MEARGRRMEHSHVLGSQGYLIVLELVAFPRFKMNTCGTPKPLSVLHSFQGSHTGLHGPRLGEPDGKLVHTQRERL